MNVIRHLSSWRIFRVQTQTQCRTRHKLVFVRHQLTLQVKRRTTKPRNYTHAGVFSKVPTSRTSPRGSYFTFLLRTVRSPAPTTTTTSRRVCTEVFVAHTYDARERHNPLAKTITAVRRAHTCSRRCMPDTGDPSSLAAATDGRVQEWNAIYGERIARAKQTCIAAEPTGELQFLFRPTRVSVLLCTYRMFVEPLGKYAEIQ